MRSRLELVVFEWKGNLHAYVQLVDPTPDRRVARRRRLASWSLEGAPEGSRRYVEEVLQRSVDAAFGTLEVAARSAGSASPWGDHRGV